MRLLVTLLFVLGTNLVLARPAEAQVGALSTDCLAVGGKASSGYQFVATCAGRAKSPDGRFAIVQRAYSERQLPIEVQDALGRPIAKLRSLSDDMPFAVFWSPNSRWFAVNHHVGSFMDRVRLFEIAGGRVVERPALTAAVVHVAIRQFPCLPSAAVLPNAVRWARDGRRLMLVTISSPYACSEVAKPGDWFPLWMIGDIETGRIDNRSVRVDRSDTGLREPEDRLYRVF